MDCAACATKIENAVSRMPGVRGVEVSVTGGSVSIDHEGAVQREAVSRQIAALGYVVEEDRPQGKEGPAHQHGHSDDHDGHGHRHAADGQEPWWRSSKGDATIACGTALAVAFTLGKAIPSIESWAFLLAMLVGLIPIAKRAFSAAFAGTPFSIEMLMTIAAVGAVFIGATEEAATVVFLFLIGELLEGFAAGRARASIRDFTKLVPKIARLEESDGEVSEVEAETLSVDALIHVRPGDRIPADGVIVSGRSSIDEAPVTGESTPVSKKVGEAVFAGTVNGESLLRIKVTASARDNTIARVVKLVEEAQESKAPTERFIDRFSRYYTPGVVVVATIVAVLPPLVWTGATWREWIYKGLAILLIGCPCALVISTPAAIAASLASGARRGLLLKGGAVLERLRDVTVACFDKTGTLTAGKPKVTDVVGFGHGEVEILSVAASLERGSSHPLALAILKAGLDKGARPEPVEDFENLAGEGVMANLGGRTVFLGSPAAAERIVPLAEDQRKLVEALNERGKTVSVLVVNGEIAGCIAMRDELRSDAVAALRRLADSGVRSVMLTGDNPRTAAALARDLGIDHRAQMMPEDKQRTVEAYKNQGEVVLKVGDGINDAPALAAADVGVAMGGGTDVALETADAAVLHGRVSDVPAMIELSKRTMGVIRQNISIALGLKAVFLVTTIAGITGLWPAILADTGATVLVTMNALRLLSVQASGGADEGAPT
jgi:Cd2+/Zn2+-exporting ATPase